MITWGDVIDIITWSFSISQTKLAELMYCDKTAISKIKRGRQSPSFTNDDLFSRIFDPATPNSPSNMWSNKPEACLRHLKEEIEDRFKEVRKDMGDFWNEENYKIFVLTLLNRARNGAPMEKASLDETPSEQMGKIFEQAVADYNIATYICKLPDYLNGEPYYAGDTFAFVDAIQTDILSKFVNQQGENIFKKISEFTCVLEAYSGFVGMIRLSISEKYGSLLKITGLNCEIINLIDEERNEIKDDFVEKNSTKGDVNESSLSGVEERLTQLDLVRSILLSHKRLCELFEDICPGKTILVFQ